MKIKKNATQLLALTASAVCLTSALHGATLFSDSFSSDSLSSYTINSTGTAGVTYGATAGVGGGGGLLIANSGNPSTSIIPGAATNNTGFTIDLGAAKTVTMSMMLKYSGSLSGTTQGFLGFSNGQDYNFGSNTVGATSAVGGAVIAGINLVTRGGTNGGVGNGGTGAPNATLTSGNWYLYQVELTKPLSGSNSWTFNGSLQDFGSNGLVAGAVATSYTGATNAFGTTADTGINAAATQTFLNFGVRNQMWTAADNLSVTTIPEPSAFALIGLGLLGLATTRRRTS